MKFLFNTVIAFTVLTSLPLTFMVNNVNSNATAQTSSNNSLSKSWENAKLVRTLDLKKVYNNNSCPIYTHVIAISPNSKNVAIASYNYERSCTGAADSKNSNLTVWNLQTGELVNTLFKGTAGEAFSFGEKFEPLESSSTISGEIAHAVAWSPDGKTIAAALGNKTIKVWNSSNGKEIFTLKGHKYAVRTVAFTPDGKTLVTGSADKTIKLWNSQTGQLKTTLQGHKNIVNLVKISPDNQTFISQTETKNIKLWNLKTGKLITNLSPGNSPDNLLPVTYSPDGKIVSIADDRNIVKLFNSTTGKLIKTFTGNQEKVRILAFDLSGKTIISNSDDNTIKTWDINTGKVKYTLNNAGLTKFNPSPITDVSPDGKNLAISSILNANDGNYPLAIVRVWNLQTGKVIRMFPLSYPFAFSPDSKTLIGVGSEGVKVWQ